jgi:hypothetical protein
MDVDALIGELDRAAPGFRAYFVSDSNLFDHRGAHAAFAACSQFVRMHPFGFDSWERLAALANRLAGGHDTELDNAVCTCFLENLASPEHPMKPLLHGQALAYWKKWE